MDPIRSLLDDLTTRDDPAGYLVLADALAERGNIRADLVRAQLQVEESANDSDAAKRVHDILGEHAQALAGLPIDEGVKVTWRRGFVDTLEVGERTSSEVRDHIVEAVATHEGCALTRELTLAFGRGERHGLNRRFRALAEAGHRLPSTLGTLRLGTAFLTRPGLRVYENFERLDAQDDLSPVWGVCPSVRKLIVDAGLSEVTLGSGPLPHLVNFEWISPATWDLKPLTQLDAPALQRMAVWTGRFQSVNWTSEAYAPGFDEERGRGATRYGDLAPILAYADARRDLRELGILNFDGFWGQVAPRLVKHDVAKRLTTFDISRGRLDDGEVAPFLEALRTMPRLERVVADEVYVSDAGWDALSSGLPGGVVLDGVAAFAPSRFTYVSAQE